ncbi:MAG: alanine--glyoxylate aminotransferase family protein [Chloroflexi bacterium]|nr:alanine--glyoxylate aminotransferase family protein [Chloroflexota bacterium]
MMTASLPELTPPARTLLGPGPANVHPRVLQASIAPLLGHLDPVYLRIMHRTGDLLRPVFGTDNLVTLAIAGTGHSGMEAGFVSLVEPGERVLVTVAGFFGQRIAEVARRAGTAVTTVEAEFGRIVEPDQIAQALKTGGPFKAVVAVHAETSTGVHQPLGAIAHLAREHGALLIADCVTSLGGLPVDVDATGIDYAYSCSQKCLGSVPGLSPITLSERAWQALKSRRSPARSWYLDVEAIWTYWSSDARYHHTAPITQFYALAEALQMAHEEGLAERFRRHQVNGDALQAGLEAMGLKLFAQSGHRLPMLTTVWVPDGVDDVRLRRELLDVENIEIGAGFGPLAGRIWRIGLMGYNAQPATVLLALAALDRAIHRQGIRVEFGAAAAAANRVYAGANARSGLPG